MIREYSYAQLHDLQSRLMLVAGKAEMGKDDVDRFILVCYCFYQLIKNNKPLVKSCPKLVKFTQHILYK
jgi:hypothetical protein